MSISTNLSVAVPKGIETNRAPDAKAQDIAEQMCDGVVESVENTGTEVSLGRNSVGVVYNISCAGFFKNPPGHIPLRDKKL